MNKVLQLKEAARQQVFSACELLYKRGARTIRDFSVRKIREVKMELFGVGGKFNTIPGYRDEWLEQAGLLGEKETGNVIKTQGDSLDTNQSLESAFNDFVKQQANKLAGEVKVNLEKKVTEQNEEIEKLKLVLAEKNREIEGLKNFSSGSGVAFDDFAEIKAQLIIEKKLKNEFENKFNDNLSELKQIQTDFLQAKEMLKEKETRCETIEKELAQYYSKVAAVKAESESIQANKAMLEIRYREALQDLSLAERELKWYKEKEKEQSNELNKSLSYASKIIEKLQDK